jgi:hypothetical protein
VFRLTLWCGRGWWSGFIRISTTTQLMTTTTKKMTMPTRIGPGPGQIAVVLAAAPSARRTAVLLKVSVVVSTRTTLLHSGGLTVHTV